jgi:Cys-rich four helix bundle protein (predicted Tat secretion target)
LTKFCLLLIGYKFVNRRDLMTHTSAAAQAALSTAAMATDDPHAHHHAQGNRYWGLIAATADCGAKGQICVSHCIELLEQGEKEMTACAKSVSQMLALCGALGEPGDSAVSIRARLDQDSVGVLSGLRERMPQT